MKQTFSPNYLAGEFEIDRQTAVRALKDVEPDEITKGRGTFSIATFSRALELHRLGNASNANDGGDNAASGLTAARIRIANASAAQKERENDIAMGQLVKIRAVVDMLVPEFRAIRETMLGLPGTIADSLTPHCSEDYGAIVDIVRVRVYENLDALSNPTSLLKADIDDIDPESPQ